MIIVITDLSGLLFNPDKSTIDILAWFMADGGLLMIYRSMTTEELLDLRATLMDQMLSLKDYTSMTAGGKSFTRDMRQLTSQLEAVTFVLTERGSCGTLGYDAVGVTDFSGYPKGYHPPGTAEELNY